MSETVTYAVPEVHCAHCEAAIIGALGAVDGVESVKVDLERKLVAVTGDELHDATLRAAIAEAGYDVV
jgi:copper chaperone